MITLTDTGKKAGFTDSGEKVQLLLREIALMEWHDIPVKAPFSQAYALGVIIGSTPGKGIAVSWNRVIDGCALLGIKAQEGNLVATSFWMDDINMGATCVAFRKETKDGKSTD